MSLALEAKAKDRAAAEWTEWLAHAKVLFDASRLPEAVKADMLGIAEITFKAGYVEGFLGRVAA